MKDDDSDFEDFRQNALDLVKDVQFIVGPDEIVGQVFKLSSILRFLPA